MGIECKKGFNNKIVLCGYKVLPGILSVEMPSCQKCPYVDGTVANKLLQKDNALSPPVNMR
jgi:hypothetical protein